MAFGLLPTGFSKKTLQDIKTEIEDDFRGEFGDAIDLDARRPIGQQIAIFAERIAELWDLSEAVYFSQYPDSAAGVSLDNAIRLTGTTRRAATYSTGAITINGTPTTLVPAGFLVKVAGAEERLFETLNPATIGGGGFVAGVLVRAVNAGAIEALAGTLTVIDTPLFGVASVTNPLDIDPGTERELDSEVRLRRLDELQNPGTSAIEGIRNSVLTLDFVDQCIVVENDTDATVSGRPPHSFEVFVDDDGNPANDPLIAEKIFLAKPAGIESVGTESETVIDSAGIGHTIKFSQPTKVNIYVIVNIDKNTDGAEAPIYPGTGDAQVEAKVLEYAETLSIGRDVWVNQIYNYINQVAGVKGIEILIGTAPSPVLSNNIVIGPTEVAKFDSTRITVNS